MRALGRFSIPLLFALLAVLTLMLSIYRPFHNWDLIGYIASAKSFEEKDFATLHAFTYEQVRQAVPAATYDELMSGRYRGEIGAVPAAFREQLSFYQIRPVYTGIVYLLHKAGINIVFATHIVSGIAVTIAIAVLYLISVNFLARPLIYAVPPMAIIFGVLDLARASSPDGLAFLGIMLSAHLYFLKHFSVLKLLLPVVVGIRTDFILFTIPLLLSICLFDKKGWWSSCASVLVSLALYFGIGLYWNNPGWETIFYFTLVEFLPYPVSMPPALTVGHYADALVEGIKSLLHNKAFMIYVIVSIYTFAMVFSRRLSIVAKEGSSPATVLSLVSLFFVFTHFILFPVAWVRFFTGPFLVGGISFLYVLGDYLRGGQGLSRAPDAPRGSPAP